MIESHDGCTPFGFYGCGFVQPPITSFETQSSLVSASAPAMERSLSNSKELLWTGDAAKLGTS